MQVKRFDENPSIHPEMDKRIGGNINGQLFCYLVTCSFVRVRSRSGELLR